MTSFWDLDPSRPERCKQLWADGLSASQVAAELGCTRNAVLSKVHRHGWTDLVPGSKRAPTRGASRRPRRITRPVRILHRAALPDDQLDEAIGKSFAEGGAKPLASLLSDDCRWPIGHPGDPEFAFCAAHSVAGLPYCAVHSRIAHQRAA